MNKERIEYFKSELLKKREELVGGVEKARSNSREVNNNEILDSGDEAANTYIRQVFLRLGEGERKELNAVEEALVKIQDEEYGICEECGKNIPEKRLEVKPYAKYCIKCKEIMEEEGRALI